MDSGSLSLGINKDFRFLTLSHIFIAIGNGFRSIAIPWLVSLLGGSTFDLAVAFTMSVIDSLLFPLTGCIVDVVSRRKLMILTVLMRDTILLLIFFMYSHYLLNLPLLYSLLFLSALLFGIFYNARFAAIPDIVSVDLLDKANSILFALSAVISIASMFTSGLVIIFIGKDTALLMAAIFGIIGGVFLAPIKTPKQKTYSILRCIKNVKEETKIAVKTVKETIVKNIIITGVLINLPIASFTLILAVISFYIIENPLFYSILLSSHLIGDVIGNWLQNKVSWKRTEKYYKGILLTGLGCIMLGISNNFTAKIYLVNFNLNLVLLIAFTAFVGIAEPFFNVSGTSLIQASVPNENLGKVSTLINSIYDLSFIPSYVIAGIMLTFISPFNLLTLYGIILVPISYISMRLLENK